jgi:anti-sigma regulatory factor (Ser/Thr protein kinase)
MRTPQDARGSEVREYILSQVDDHPHDITQLTARHFSMTRQAVNLHLQRLIADRDLTRKGKTRSTRFYLAPQRTWRKQYNLTGQNPSHSEHDVWEGDILPQLADLPENALDICRYSFTEMFNNAIDHSAGSRVTVRLKRTVVNVEIVIVDNGVGIFKKIQRAMKFRDARYSALELAKGKFTTDPKRHTGEGIFFTSKMLDAFDISSGGVYFASPSSEISATSALVSPKSPKIEGTAVWMKLRNNTTRSRKEVFDTFASPENDYAFDKTIVPVKLAEQNPNDLVSRSQAKRLLLRIDRFRTVVLDFTNVNQIGQAFADEIFRVFARSHANVALQYVNANDEVLRMIKRAQNA